MSEPLSSFSGLPESVNPSSEGRDRMWKRISSSLEPKSSFSRVVQSVRPSSDFHASTREQILARIAPPLGEALKGLSSKVTFPLRSLTFLDALEPAEKPPMFHAWLRWSTAFVLVVLVFRLAPLVVLSPTQADTAVQLIPHGQGVQVFEGGVWRAARASEVLQNGVMIATDDISEVTLVLNDDGVLRMAANTTLKLHDLGDRPQNVSTGPTATLVRGRVWALGLLPPFIDGLSLETDRGTLALNAGSASIEKRDNGEIDVSVFDKGVTFLAQGQPTLLVAGERLAATDTVKVSKMKDSVFAESWPKKNLSQDAVHRAEIAKLQEERQKKLAGILPGSALYPVKRVAEKVDALFAFTSDAKTQKQVDQANTRINEALALLQDGQDDEAIAPLAEYTHSLVALAETGEDTLVRHLLARTLADETAKTGATDTHIRLDILQQALDDITASVPDAAPIDDLQGYLLVDKLTQVRQAIKTGAEPQEIAFLYKEVRPYLSQILSDDSTTNELLKREAEYLLMSSATLAQSSSKPTSGPLLIALDADISTFLPEESDALKVTGEELDAQVTAMVERIYVFRHPLSRYNQLLTEMKSIEKHPSRGTLLRRLKVALPDGLGEYVNTELKKLTDGQRG